MKRLPGLPELADQSVVSQLLRANAARFFLRSETPMVGPVAYKKGVWWGAVFQELVVSQIERACERLNLRLDGCVPAVAALARLCPEGCVEWCDDDVRSSIVVHSGSWIDVRRDRRGSAPGDVIPALRPLGPDASRYADAFAAASSSSRSPLLLRATRAKSEALRLVRLRFAVITACAIALGATVVARGAKASLQLSRDVPKLAQLQATTAQWTPAARQLREASSALGEVARFTRSRRSMLQLLASISKALPDSTAIVSLRVDSATGSATLLSTTAATAIPKLDAVDGIESARISGALTRETLGGAQVQRIAVRFHFAASAP